MATVDLDTFIAETEARYRLPPGLGRVQLRAESGMRPNAVSPVGARGVAQFMPDTARRYGVNVNDPLSSIDGWGRYMRDLLTRFDGRVDLALAGYNAGEGAVEKHGRQVPPYEETRKYVGKILTAWLPTAQAAQSTPAREKLASEMSHPAPPPLPAGKGFSVELVGMPKEELLKRMQAWSDVGGTTEQLVELGREWERANAPPPKPFSQQLGETVESYAPLITGTLAGLSTGGLGIVPAALVTAGVAGGTRLLQKPDEPGAAALEGLSQGAGQAGVAAGLRGLGALGRRFIAPGARSVSDWAAAHGLPSLPASRAGRALEAGAERLAGGAIAARKPADAMLQGLEREAAALSPTVRDVPTAAARVAEHFADTIKGGKAAEDAAYGGVRALLSTREVPVPRTAAVLDQAVTRLTEKGVDLAKDPVARKLVGMRDALASGSGTRVGVDFYDDLQAVTRAARTAKTGKDVLKGVVDAMRADLDGVAVSGGGSLLKMHDEAAKLYSQGQGLIKSTGLAGLQTVRRDPGGYLRSLLADTGTNRALWTWLAKSDPAAHAQALDGALAATVARFGTDVPATGQRVLNGPAFARWVGDNAAMLRQVAGPERFAAIQGFARWAESVYPTAVRRALPPSGLSMTRALEGGAGSAGAYLGSPGALLGLAASEASAFGLVRSLTSPTGTLFRLFSGLPLTAGKARGAQALGGALGSALGPTPPELPAR